MLTNDCKTIWYLDNFERPSDITLCLSSPLFRQQTPQINNDDNHHCRCRLCGVWLGFNGAFNTNL